MTTTSMPAAFIGHGTPMNALEFNRYTETWRALGSTLPTPRALVVVSAHWYIDHTAVTAMAAPRTIHDFYGFPDELFAVEYPAPGSPEVAELVAEVAKPNFVGLDSDAWGIDHGTWSVLVHAFPEADIPVIQLSINATKPLEHHFDLGARLAPLRDQGIIVIGSGNIVHNLRAVDFRLAGAGYDWADSYDEQARELLTSDPSAILSLVDHPAHQRAVPTPDHFIPMLYVAGLAAAAQSPLDVLVGGREAGSLSMTSYTLGLEPPTSGPPASGAGALNVADAFPDPDVVPPEHSNV